MKRLNIQKKLKSESNLYTPDLLDEIKAKAVSENLLSQDSHTSKPVSVNGSNSDGRFKRKIWSIASSVCAVACCLVLVFCFVLGKGGNTNNRIVNLSASDLYGIGAVSSIKLLNCNTSVSAIKALSDVSASTSSDVENSGDVKDQAKKFNEYFTALDSFLGEDIVTTETSSNVDSEYPYETKMVINGKDIDGETVVYTMYYTEALSDALNDSEDDDDEFETQKAYVLKGVMVIDGKDYYLEGQRVEENEIGESENELRIRAYLSEEDRSSYVEMEQENSVEDGETETEYVYSVYSNGTLIEQTAVDFETEREGGEVETEYELEFRNGTGVGRYVVEKVVKDGKTEIKVEYAINQKVGEFSIVEIIGADGEKQYEYTFEDQTKLIF